MGGTNYKIIEYRKVFQHKLYILYINTKVNVWKQGRLLEFQNIFDRKERERLDGIPKIYGRCSNI